MEIDTVLRFVGQDVGSKDVLWGTDKNESCLPEDTLETMARTGRFLAPSHQILMDLKLRFISQIEIQVYLGVRRGFFCLMKYI